MNQDEIDAKVEAMKADAEKRIMGWYRENEPEAYAEFWRAFPDGKIPGALDRLKEG